MIRSPTVDATGAATGSPAGRRRILLIAEACNPEWASVPLVGWSLARALAEVADVHVVTQVRNREALQRAGWRDGVQYTAIDNESVARPVWRFGETLRRVTGMGWTTTTALAALPYYDFERRLWGRFGEEVRAGGWDVVHRVTPLSPTLPSLLARRCRDAGVPFVVGPLNGGVAWPAQFQDAMRKEGEWLSKIRDGHHLLPGYRSTRTNAAAILLGSKATWSQFGPFHERCVYLPENAVDPGRFPAPAHPPAEGPLKIVFVGRLVPYKGADMLLEAAAELVRAGKVVVDVVGDGPEMQGLRDQVARAGMDAGVRFHGWVPHTGVARLMASSHLLAFPSVREFGGGVVLEAMAMGIVPLVVDYAGPAELVTDATGLRVPLGTRAEVVAGFRAALESLAADRRRLAAMGARARRRVERSFTWAAKASQVLQVYDWVLGRGARPDFGMPIGDPPDGAA